MIYIDQFYLQISLEEFWSLIKKLVGFTSPICSRPPA